MVLQPAAAIVLACGHTGRTRTTVAFYLVLHDAVVLPFCESCRPGMLHILDRPLSWTAFSCTSYSFDNDRRPVAGIRIIAPPGTNRGSVLPRSFANANRVASPLR